MKYTIAFLLMITSLTACAQPQAEPSHLVPPKTYWQSFGFQKQPKQVGIGYYKSDSLGYEPAMLEVYNFNEDGFITQKYIRIFGEYGSETVNNYVYSNGVLDSINTLASAKTLTANKKCITATADSSHTLPPAENLPTTPTPIPTMTTEW
ncbi:hypothetical protein BCY91_15010 [Pelobium manganitolerans]|uniref:Lipoprotein n=1 Tax=Pelobium manganitolerans TaxID=1842495 RepID=A0A419S9E3_9SPHI|nr:hypothetical protein [Pelobium manganitolerans]RKD18643.1 hypothetical protein BCY91_15010 [Pelobium manganitolerans]